MADIDGMFGDEVNPLDILDTCNHLHILSVSGATGLYVGFCADGCTVEFGILSFYVVHTLGFERTVFVGELEFVPFVKQMQHGYSYFAHIT